MINRLHLAMIDLYGADAKRIQHFCKVHSYAKLIAEAVDDEMGEDYAKLAGLTAEEDLNETTRQSIRKRLPWLIILLILGMAVSSVVGAFEGVVAILPIVICFQSLVLDMAGNVGTQSLAVTIRVLMDEEQQIIIHQMVLAFYETNVELKNKKEYVILCSGKPELFYYEVNYGYQCFNL